MSVDPDSIRSVEAAAEAPGDRLRLSLVPAITEQAHQSAARPSGPTALYDVAGREDVKAGLREWLSSPERGLLMYGPPGCGKGYMARALAAELEIECRSVVPDEVLDPWFGNTRRNVRNVFEKARAAAPCVLLLEGADVMGGAQERLCHAASRDAVKQLTEELDRHEDNHGLYVIAATSRPWEVDPALMEPGRLGYALLVAPPDEQSRKVLLVARLGAMAGPKVDWDQLARRTEGMSGADLAEVCEAAVASAAERSGQDRPVVRMPDIAGALWATRPSPRRWFDTAQEWLSLKQ